MSSWKTHMAALGAGALLGIGGISAMDADKLKAEEAKTAEVRLKLESCLSNNRELRDENKTLREVRSEASQRISALRDENEKMSRWMKLLMEQEERRIKEEDGQGVCLNYSGIDKIPADFNLSDEERNRISEILGQGCKIDGIIDGSVRFSQITNCGFSSVSLQNAPERDYYSRESFGKELSAGEEELLSLMEEKKYDEVIERVSVEQVRADLASGLERANAPKEVMDGFEEWLKSVENYKKDSASFEEKCALVIAFGRLEDLVVGRDNSEIRELLDGNFSLGALLEAVEEGVELGDEEEQRCLDTLPE